MLHPPLRLFDAVQRNIRPLLSDLVTVLPRIPLLLQHLASHILPGSLALQMLLHLLEGDALPVLLLPELVFFPEELDFPRARRPEGAFFIEASVDTQRRDSDFPWERLDASASSRASCSAPTRATINTASRANESRSR